MLSTKQDSMSSTLIRNYPPRTLVIIPAYNEADSLAYVIENVQANANWVDIAVVNDGSRDTTPDIARQKGVVLLNMPYNVGIGGAVQTGYKYAAKMGYDVAVQVDGDGQHPANQIEHLVTSLIDTGANMVIGSRFVENNTYTASISRSVGIQILSRIISLLARQHVTDTTSGFRAVDRRAIRYLAVMYPRDYPEPETIILLQREGFRIVEVPIVMKERMGGVSSITFLKGLYYIVKVLLAIMIDMFKAPVWKEGEN
jgi:glycosyltransferase involved in cell wall biosynthesis